MESESETSNWSHNNAYDLEKKLQLDLQVHVGYDFHNQRQMYM